MTAQRVWIGLGGAAAAVGAVAVVVLSRDMPDPGDSAPSVPPAVVQTSDPAQPSDQAQPTPGGSAVVHEGGRTAEPAPADTPAERLAASDPELGGAQDLAPPGQDVAGAAPQDAAPEVAQNLSPPELSAQEPPDTASADAAPEGAQDDPALPAPEFDIVRAEPDGSMLIAGSAPAGTDVAVLADGAELGRAVAGADGRFVIFADLPSLGRAQVLQLRSDRDGLTLMSDQEVIVAPPPPQVAGTAPADPTRPGATPSQTGIRVATGADAQVARAAPLAPSAPAMADAPDLADDSPARPATTDASRGVTDPATPDRGEGIVAALPDRPAPAPRPAQPVGPSAPPAADAPMTLPTGPAGAPPDTVARATPAPDAPAEGTVQIAATPGADDAVTDPGPAPDPAMPDATQAAPTVLLSSGDGIEVLQAAPLGPSEVALDSISYTQAGDVLLAGRGADDAFLRIYLDNAPVTTSRIRDDGRWRVELPQIDSGTYTLRVDQLGADGQVIARVESPFQRESLENLRAAGPDRLGAASAVVVQPGNTLWAIARERYGEGIEYVRVFRANRDLIRDPDLIYPGQIFALPDGG